jgi:glycosyltransferase involved in cell wall biosynthesis
VRRICIVCGERVGETDAIAQYSIRLGRALNDDAFVIADVHLRQSDGGWRVVPAQGSDDQIPGRSSLAGLIEGYGVVVIEYNPFGFGRWGFAPWLPAELARVRARRRRPRVALMVHEPYVPMTGGRQALMAVWQHAQLDALRALSDVVFTSIEAWAELFRHKRPRRATYHLPVPSNLPNRREARFETRARLGVTEDEVVVSAFGTDHPSRLLGHIVSAANAVVRLRDKLLLLNLGSGAPTLDGLDDRVKVIRPGELPERELAEFLSAADLFLAPFVDGVSTRRSTMMSALQHGVAVVGTNGPLTDALLQESAALRLTPVHRPDLFARAAVELADRPDERSTLGGAGSVLYQSRFDWPVLADELLGSLESV